MKYAVTFNIYDRYSMGECGCEFITSESDVKALIKIEKDHGDGHYANIIDEGTSIDTISLNEIEEYLDSNNGDGCDFIISVINMSTQKIIFLA